EVEHAAVVEREADLDEAAGILAARAHVHAAGHAQVAEQRSRRLPVALELRDDVLRAPPHRREARADDRALEATLVERAERLAPRHLAPRDPPPDEQR